jgi:Phytanoyl-CoA dioxygenase (PhyH)
MPLTALQAECFRRDGYLHLCDFLPSDKVADLRRACMDYFEKGHGRSRNSARVETDIPRRVPEIAWLLTWPPALEVARQLVGPAVLHPHETAVHLGAVNRGWHKDSRDYHREDPNGTDWQDDYRVIHFAYYLQDHRQRSGALAVKRGSHRIRNHVEGPVVPILNGPGDLVVFDLRTTHTGNTVMPRSQFEWLPESLVHPIPSPSQRSRRRFQPLPLLQAALQRLPFVYEQPYADRLAIFFVYGADDQHTRNFFDYLKARPDYGHLAAYESPARLV